MRQLGINIVVYAHGPIVLVVHNMMFEDWKELSEFRKHMKITHNLLLKDAIHGCPNRRSIRISNC